MRSGLKIKITLDDCEDQLKDWARDLAEREIEKKA